MAQASRTGAMAAAAALAVLGAVVAHAQEPARGAAEAEGGNGAMAAFGAMVGDPALGATLYQARCASCHDKPEGRTPGMDALAGLSRTTIASALVEGVMRPMATGLKPAEIAGIAAHLSKRPEGVASAAMAEAPACRDRPPPMTLSGPGWNGWGRDIEQSRLQPDPGLKAADVPRLQLKWAFAYPGTRNGQATIVGGRVFLTSTAGGVYSLNARTGCAYWRFDAPGGSRSSITVGRLPSGRHAAYFTGWVERTAYALDAETGQLIWKVQVDDQREVQMTGSPVLHADTLYIPVSSAEEAIASNDAYECCKFQGAVVAVDAATGRVRWRTFVPPTRPAPFKTNPKGTQMYGPAGGAIWSAPTVDAKRGLIYVATGDSYTDVEFDTADAILALDMKTGAIRWKNQLTKGDNYIIGCYGQNRRANCPVNLGPDYDFGASPILHTMKGGKQVILAGQKSSQVYALDPDAGGRLIWQKRLSQGGPLGGVEFGLAAEGDVLYAPVADIFVQGTPAAGMHAFRISDGELLWSTLTPRLPCAWKNNYCHPAISQAPTAIPGAVFGGSMDGRFRAFDRASGKVVWEYDTAGGPVPTVSGKTATGGVMDGAGPTVADGIVYVNSGYQGRSGTPGIVLMAFSVDGR